MVALIATAGIGGATMGVGPGAGLQTGVAQQENPLETQVSLEPGSATVTSGETTIGTQNEYDAQFELDIEPRVLISIRSPAD